MPARRRAAAASYDAIVVGAGHNGLVCASYLARAGLRTLVLERREIVGGLAATSELAPGVRVPTIAHSCGRLRASVVRDLGLREHGLALVQPQIRVFAPQPDGRAISLWADTDRTVAELSANGLVDERDASNYAAAERRLRTLSSALGALMTRTPPDLSAPSPADALEGIRTGLLARTRAGSESGGLLRVLPMAVHDLAGEWFESDALRALIELRGVQYTALGPRMPGTASVLLSDAAGNDGGLAGQTVFARAGPGALGSALEQAARRAGAEIRTGAQVIAVRSVDDRVAGVALASGEEIDASIVASALDPKQTLLDLLAPDVLGPQTSWRASNIRQQGATAKVNIALNGLPQFSGLADESELRGRIIIAPSTEALRTATDAVKYGHLAAEPILEATIPSLVDSELVDERRAGDVRHVMSVVVHAAPYDLHDEGWNDRREELGYAVLRTLEQYAPGVSALVEQMDEITPLDLERDYGLREGHALHAEAGLDQWFAWRPLHGLGRYRMPLDGYYLCASGAHPGGGITGGPGQLAAREIIADLKHAPTT
jgi:phytoene dehydrogenase-like protein